MADRHQAQAYPLRLQEELKAKVAAAANEAGRSLNAEIADRLARSFEPSVDDEALRAENASLRDLAEIRAEAAKAFRGAHGLQLQVFQFAIQRMPQKIRDEYGLDELIESSLKFGGSKSDMLFHMRHLDDYPSYLEAIAHPSTDGN